MGKSTIEDVLNGYNGTILAYGQTGSGKTFTMFGANNYEEEYKGVIPRSAFNIFKTLEVSTDIKEVEIRCSMLEIYKEELRDLFTKERTELKIKESPERGIYVEGICENSVGSDEELLYWINVGEERRVWAETRHNAVSSRSHTLLMLEVKQILGNDSIKKGKLNLVDLAGSEKIGKSGATGQIFQEGTKINLSLYALGNVIHALTANLDHIPYRDSKLTRILQESLGGNYKTTLIFTCSPYSSEQQESLSTLKFAQRAKKLKNSVQMNIITNPCQLLKIIEDLRNELRIKNEYIQNKILVKDANRLNNEVNSFLDSNPPEKEYSSRTTITKPLEGCLTKPPTPKRNQFPQRYSGLVALKSVPAEQEMDDLDVKLREKEQENEGLKKQLKESRKVIEKIRQEKLEIETKLRKAELSLLTEKKSLLILEQHIAELENHNSMQTLKQENSLFSEKNENMQIQVLTNQLNALGEALVDTENECFRLLKEKKEKLQQETSEMCSLNSIKYEPDNISEVYS